MKPFCAIVIFKREILTQSVEYSQIFKRPLLGFPVPRLTEILIMVDDVP